MMNDVLSVSFIVQKLSFRHTRVQIFNMLRFFEMQVEFFDRYKVRIKICMLSC